MDTTNTTNAIEIFKTRKSAFMLLEFKGKNNTIYTYINQNYIKILIFSNNYKLTSLTLEPFISVIRQNGENQTISTIRQVPMGKYAKGEETRFPKDSREL